MNIEILPTLEVRIDGVIHGLFTTAVLNNKDKTADLQSALEAHVLDGRLAKENFDALKQSHDVLAAEKAVRDKPEIDAKRDALLAEIAAKQAELDALP